VAGARKVEIDCAGSFAEAAAAVVATRSAEVFEHAEGVLDPTDPERVHDMRVTTRRLRAALEVFAPAFPAKRHRKALKRVKKLADALGARRDADVEIALLESLATEVDAGGGDRAALEALIGELRERQRVANDALAPFVRRKRLKKLRRRLRKLVKAVDR
jgi:CHAD domain-containing protein